MNELENKQIQCPYCGEFFDILVDCSVMNQSYIEDCQICCQPINLDVKVINNSQIEVTVFRDNE